eukprot:scaffold1083_cov114-Cylindrotheca_fusiformis.AAC.2
MSGREDIRRNRLVRSLSFHRPTNRELIKEDARKAVHQAVTQAFQAALLKDSVSSTMETGIHGGSASYSSDSHSSFHSHEQAMRRGSKLAQVEMNGLPDHSRRQLFLEDIDEGMTEAMVVQKDAKSKFWSRQRKLKKRFKQEEQAEREAWMCGVCARCFSSFEAAERHENYHVKEVLVDLGWGSEISDNASIFSNNSPPAGRPSRTPDRRQGASTPTNTNTQPRPDILRMSSPLQPSNRANVQPYTPTIQRKKLPTFRRDSDESDSNNEDPADEFKLATSALATPHVTPPGLRNVNNHRLIDNIDDDSAALLFLSDEALVDVCQKAELMGLLTEDENDAEFEIECLAEEKAYYDLLLKRAVQRKQDKTYRFRREGSSAISKVQNKFVDAYQLMKQGKSKRGSTTLDYYTRKLKGNSEQGLVIDHSKNTLYVNVMVKNSIRVVRHELERLAKRRWEASQKSENEETDIERKRFQKFRAAAQGNLVKLAGYALAADFTPRRANCCSTIKRSIPVRSSSSYLILRCRRRGVIIETEIEYRVGPYFVLAVNILNVHWQRLLKTANRDVTERRSRWKKENEADDKQKDLSRPAALVVLCLRLMRLTRIEVLAQLLAWMYYLHWVLYMPICTMLYHLFPKTFRTYFLSSVADEIFYYVEQKGMQMDIGIRGSSTQAAFMLSALREIRADGREQKKKKQEGDTGSQIVVIGPLLGPAIKEDKSAAPPKPAGFEIPANLGFVGLELDVPVGFKRLRWAFLSSESSFMLEAVFRTEVKYENITAGPWSKHDEVIGLPVLPDGIEESDLIGAEKETSYLMPKSAFVKANMCYETMYIEAYNDYCFCIKKKALTPEVPYGSSFIAWTKFVVINNGNDSSRLICSVEAEFPNGPPLVSRQIQSGMKSGVGELFVKIGETITKYADEYP